jgi:hypothetical protein
MLTWGVVTALAIGVFAQRVAEAPLIDYDRSDPLLSMKLDVGASWFSEHHDLGSWPAGSKYSFSW